MAQNPRRNQLRGAFELLEPRGRRAFFGAALGGAIAAAADYLVAFALAAMFQRFTGSQRTWPMLSVPGSTIATGVLLAGAVAIRAGLHALVLAWSSIVHAGVAARLRREAVDLLLTDGTQRTPTTTLLVSFTEHTPRVAQLYFLATSIASQLSQVLVLASFAVWMSPRNGSVALLVLAVVSVIAWYSNRAVRTWATELAPRQRALASAVERVARNKTLVYAMHTTEREHARLRAAIGAHSAVVERISKRVAVSGVIPPVLGTLALVVILLSTKSVFEPGQLIALAYVVVRLVGLLASITTTYSNAASCLPSFEAIREQMIARPSPDFSISEFAAPLDPISGPCEVRLESVSFSYGESRGDVLSKVSVEVRAGGSLAVVGPSGIGKTTVAKLLLGMLDPLGGRVLLAGIPAKDFYTSGGRAGYAGSDPFVFAGSVRENLVYGCAHPPTDEELWSALELACLKQEIERLPFKLDHVLAEQGSDLSAGQAQRLALARALATKPNLLILDDAASQLDAEAERVLARTVCGLADKVTRVVISHRPGILEGCERVLRLDADTRDATGIERRP